MTETESASAFIKAERQVIEQITEAYSASNKEQIIWSATWSCSRNRFQSLLQKYLLHKWKPTAYPDYVTQSWIIQWLKTLKAFLSELVRILFFARSLQRSRQKTRKDLQGKAPFLLKSFAYKTSFSGEKYTDAFWRRLPQYLEGSGKPILVVHEPIDCFSESLRYTIKSGQAILPYHSFLTTLDLFRAIAWQWSADTPDCQDLEFTTPSPNTSGEEQKISEDVKKILRADILSPGTFYSLLNYFAFQKIARQFKPQKYLLTFEGNPWEKTSIAALKSEDSRIEVIGCQHTVVPQASTGVFLGKREQSLLAYPDRILTVGKTTKEIMQRYGEYRERKVEAACALRYEYLEKISMRKDALPSCLLVALEGVPQSACLLHFLAKRISQLGEWRILVRFHPAFTYEHIQSAGLFPVSLEGRVEISRRPLLEDLAESGAVLYWGSTVSLEALKLGVPVIHLRGRHGGEEVLSFDPLFDCKTMHYNVRAGESLVSILNEIRGLDGDSLHNNRKKAQEYLANYFHAVTNERLALFAGPSSSMVDKNR